MPTTTKNDVILSGHITIANRHDIKGFKKTIYDVNLKNETPFYTDKIYPSRENDKFLKKNSFINKVMSKDIEIKIK